MPVSKLTKAGEWLSLIVSRPLEAFDRVVTVLDVQADRYFVEPPEYDPVDIEEVLEVLQEQASEEDWTRYRAEAEWIESAVRRQIDNDLRTAPIKLEHNGDFALARLCYLVCRVYRPEVVLETGVAYGVTSRFILSALETNEAGRLYSIDLPPLGPDVEAYVGYLVPADLKGRWDLRRGVTKRELPRLLSELSTVDLFVHDSLHTYRNIRMELERVTPQLSDQAIVIADDVDENAAFLEWLEETPLAFGAAVQEEEKDRLLGVGITGPE